MPHGCCTGLLQRRRCSVQTKCSNNSEIDRRSLSLGSGSLLLSTFLPKFVADSKFVDNVIALPVFDSNQLMQNAYAHPPLPTQFPRLPHLQSLPHQNFLLQNGVEVFLVEDRELPLIAGTLLFPGGWYSVPYDKMGLASISCGVQRAGGSSQFPSDKFSDELEKIGASVESGASPFALVQSFSCLKGDERGVMNLASNLISQPNLSQQEINLWKNRFVTNISHRNDQVSGVGRRELQRLLYGKESLYARLSTLKTVKSIQQSDIQQFLAEQQVAQGAVIGVVGDFDSSEMRQNLEDFFGDAFESANSFSYKVRSVEQGVKIPSSKIPEYTTGGQAFVIDFPNSKNCNVAMGQFGIDLFHPDVYALDVLSGMLNSFGGKLFNQVRSEQGLAYSISGGWDTPPDHRGLFQVVGDTNDVGRFIEAVKVVLTDILQSPPDPIILEKAKNKVANAFVFNFSSSRQQLQRLMVYKILGLPEDYLFEYQKGLANVTSEDVLQAARRHLDPESLTFVVAGPAKSIIPQLQSQGYQPKLLEI